MMKLNASFQEMPESYLFTETAQRAASWTREHPGRKLIRLGIGDVTLPLCSAASAAMAKAALELSTEAGFRGYGPEQGYGFLREAIATHDYQARNVQVEPDEIFVSDGAKTDCGGILELFDSDCRIGICDPVYPAYVDAAAISGRAGQYDKVRRRWSSLYYLPCTEKDGFIPLPPEVPVDLVYLCFPNNPTGAVATEEQLREWITWANECGAVILFDGAYEAYIRDDQIPHSIFQIPGAERCAIELRSFSKNAGFTGVRCGYTVIPKSLERNGIRLNKMWKRRLAGRSNGVSYVVQRGAEATYTPEGRREILNRIDYYQRNAEILRYGLMEVGLQVYGGENAPYLWVKTPDGMPSWELFDLLLEECALVTTPGVGFGPCGEGFLRLTAFGQKEEVEEAVRRIKLKFTH